jgi:peptide-methionine (S)-S-oxide reductase
MQNKENNHSETNHSETNNFEANNFEANHFKAGQTGKSQTAVLGGGCFWCLEAIFSGLKGVVKVESGYSGGNESNPDYEKVCSGNTGHAEVVRIKFDPNKISYEILLRIFFTVHDPTTLNRQGNDSGTQYRSIIFYDSPEQEQTALRVIEDIKNSRIYKDSLVTEVKPLGKFYKAEDYHQEYFSNNPGQPYCQVVISPKVEHFRKNFESYLK